MKKQLSEYMALAMSMAMMSDTSRFGNVDRNDKPWGDVSGEVFRVCPKGCKEYFFNDNGEFSTDHMRRSECVFTCYAINNKSAIKKFNKRKK